MRKGIDRRAKQAGFTLIETLAALALLGVILSALATLTGQWLPSWSRGFGRIQRNEALSIALDRISADIEASEFVRPNAQTKNVLFDGTELSLILARTSLGPNAAPGLDVVRIAQTADKEGIVLIRSRSKFVPSTAEDYNFSDPVALLRAPYRVSFSYAGKDKSWKNNWRETDSLPTAVLVTVRDASTQQTLAVSRIAVIHVNAPAECAAKGCDKDGAPQGGAPGTPTSQTSSGQAQR